MAYCKDKKKYLNNLRKVNQRAGVDPELTDLLVAFAGVRLEKNKRVNFFQDNNIKRSASNSYFAEFLQKNKTIDPRALDFLASYFLEMKSRGLLCVFSRPHLADILGVSCAEMEKLAANAPRYYNRFFTDKKNGGKREVLAPKEQLKRIQRRILSSILEKVYLSNYAEGFRKNHSILTNARRHTDQKVIVKIDIKDFFPSTTSKRVHGMFVALGYPEGVAVILTDLTTYKGRLATGAPTSPAISNILCRRLDKRFAGLGDKCDFSYSRYADDLTISSANPKMVGMIPFFKQIINEEGYEVNEKKLSIMRSGGRQKVTGIIVNQKPNIGREEVRKLRAVIYNCRQKDIKKEIFKWAKYEKNHPMPSTYTMETFQRSLAARVNYIKMVNPEVGEKLLAEYKLLQFPA
jgi:retron-type reverse transcriptase